MKFIKPAHFFYMKNLNLYISPKTMASTKNPLLTGSKGIRGGVLKQIVIKQYKHKTIVSKYPDMSAVIPSESQLKEKVRFADAVIFAKEIINDPVKKAAYKRIDDLSVYHSAIKNYMDQK